MSDALVFLSVVLAIGALLWLVRRDDGHWCSRDGLRFSCRVQPVGESTNAVDDARRELRALRELNASSLFSMSGLTRGFDQRPRRERSWPEARATIGGEGLHLLVRRGLSRQVIGPCRVVQRSDDERGRAVYVVEGPPLYLVRVPRQSRCVAHLDGFLPGA